MLHGFLQTQHGQGTHRPGGAGLGHQSHDSRAGAGETLAGTQCKQGYGSLPTDTANRQMVQKSDFPSVRINIKKQGVDVARLKDTCAQPDGAHKNNSAHGGAEHGRVAGERPL